MKIFNLRDILPQIPALIFKREFAFEFELLSYRARGIGWRKATNFFLAGLNQYVLPSKPLGYPVVAQVEPANFCNLSCPLCLTSSITHSRSKALLPFETFQRFIDDCGDYLLHLIFWNWGEPFLNPDFIRMIAYAKAKNIIVHTSTNGNVPLNEAKALALVDSGLDSLVVAVDGASQEVYAKYRQGGRLDRVIENIETILRARRIRGVMTPRINMRFVVMIHNETEIAAAREIARSLGVDYFMLKTVDMPQTRGTDLDQTYAPRQKNYRRYAYEQDTFKRREKPFECMRPWKRVTLEASGEVIPCEYDYCNKHSFGNIMKSGTMGAWKSQSAADFRGAFHKGNNEFEMCKTCTYKNRVAEDCTVECYAAGGPCS